MGAGKISLNTPSGAQRPSSIAHGFTLTETLVVIGLIAVLVALLLPAIVGARRQANLVRCASNLRQLGAACLLNAHEKRGYLPLSGAVVARFPAYGGIQIESSNVEAIPICLNDRQRRRYSYGGGDDATFFLVPLPAALSGYLGIKDLPFKDVVQLDLALNDNRGVWKMFMCPETDALHKGRVNNVDSTPEGQGTVMSVAFQTDYVYAWSTNTDYAFNEGLMGFHWDPQYSSRRLAGHLTSARRPSEMVLATDARRRSTPAFFWSPDGWICWTPSLDSTGPVTLADAFLNNGRASDKSSFDLRRHKGRMNVLFADGHVDLLRITEPDLRRAHLLTK